MVAYALMADFDCVAVILNPPAGAGALFFLEEPFVYSIWLL